MNGDPLLLAVLVIRGDGVVWSHPEDLFDLVDDRQKLLRHVFDAVPILLLLTPTVQAVFAVLVGHAVIDFGSTLDRLLAEMHVVRGACQGVAPKGVKHLPADEVGVVSFPNDLGVLSWLWRRALE